MGAHATPAQVAALLEPYDLRQFPEAVNYICTYGDRPAALAALAATLFGDYVPSGSLPVTV